MFAETAARESVSLDGASSQTQLEAVRLGDILATPADCNDWDRFAVTCDGAVQEQLAAFARSRWPAFNLEPWIFSKPGNAIGRALVMVRPLRMKLGQVAICKWGPLLKDETSDDVPMQHRLMTAALRQIYAGQRGMMLSIMPRAEPAPDNSAWSNLQTLGFRPGAELRYPARYLVNVRLDGDAAIRSLEQKWRYNLRQSFRHGLRFEAGEPQQLGEFDALYKAMSDRKRFADHSAYGSFDRFMEEIVPEARPRLFFVRKDGELVAGAVVLTCGRTAVYLYGATNAAALPLRAGYFMHWHIIAWLRENTQAQWYDLGGTDGFNGLHQFKKGLVGDSGFVSPVPPVMNCADTLRARLAGGLAHAVYGGVQKLKFHAGNWRHGFARPDQKRQAP
jgi:hypothetical protein